jgi:hypothetical protein
VLKRGANPSYKNFPPYINEYFFEDADYLYGIFGSSNFQNYDSSDVLLHYGGKWVDGSFYKVTPNPAMFPKEMEIGKTYTVEFQRSEYDNKS